jgi:hypothetical protein
VRSDRWPKWACRRRTREKRGTTRTLAGSVRSYMTTIHDLGTLRILRCTGDVSQAAEKGGLNSSSPWWIVVGQTRSAAGSGCTHGER